jgi:hypothetical protein
VDRGPDATPVHSRPFCPSSLKKINVTQCGLVGRYQRFEETYSTASLIRTNRDSGVFGKVNFRINRVL